MYQISNMPTLAQYTKQYMRIAHTLDDNGNNNNKLHTKTHSKKILHIFPVET